MRIGSATSGQQDYSSQRTADGADNKVQAKMESAKAEASKAAKVDVQKSGDEPDSHQEFSEEWMKKSVDQANKALAQHGRFIERDVHPVTHTVMYKIMDTSTKEVIAEYPPKKIQDMVAKMWELAGLFVDEKA